MSKWTKKDRLRESGHFNMDVAIKEREYNPNDKATLAVQRSFDAVARSTAMADALARAFKQ